MVPRVLTSLVGIPVLVAAIWFGSPWLTVLVVVVVVLGVREVYRLAPRDTTQLSLTLGALWAIALVLGGQASSGPVSLLVISLGIILAGAFVALLWLIAFCTTPDASIKKLLIAGLYLIGGPIYIGFPLAHALALRDFGDPNSLGRDWLLFALLVTFATDTGAFFTGRAIGRRPMAPRISPNKTWEGAAGGFILAMVVALALGIAVSGHSQLLHLFIPLWQQIAIGATIGVVAQLGDLFESKLKRLSRTKDAGSIIPGHGGILDRLDSIVVSIPTVYYIFVIVFKP